MKRVYVTPETEVLEMKPSSILCISGDLGGDATEPGHAPEWSDKMFNFGGWDVEWEEE